ncbi:hypothetical protein FRC15_004046 [Serendipita sp. 397]|nr:hypothetical protein FRC15_004046 [Serendipita sp. 397]
MERTEAGSLHIASTLDPTIPRPSSNCVAINGFVIAIIIDFNMLSTLKDSARLHTSRAQQCDRGIYTRRSR